MARRNISKDHAKVEAGACAWTQLASSVVGYSSSRRRWLAGLSALTIGVLAGARPSLAAIRGRFRLTRRVVRETDDGWRVLVAVTLTAPPPTSVVEVDFDLRLVAVFEGEEGKKRKRKVEPPKLVTLHRSVDFSDPQGRIGTNARTDLVLVRGEGFEPGEWTIQLRGPDGPIGARADLVLREAGEG